MNNKSIFGWIATLFSLTYKLPQIHKMYKTKLTNGISLKSYIIQTISYIFYIIHGSFNRDYPIIVMGISSSIQCSIIIFLWHKYKKEEHEDE